MTTTATPAGRPASREPSAAEPFPLATHAAVRILAWPRYDDGGAELRLVVALLAGATVPGPGLCLCLRVDPEGDPPLEAVVPLLEATLAPLQRFQGLDVLVVDDPLAPSDAAALGAALAAVIDLPSSSEPDRARLLEALARPRLAAAPPLRQRNDTSHLLSLQRLFLGTTADPERRVEHAGALARAAPGYRPARVVLAECLLAAGHPDEAADVLRACLAELYDDVHVQGLFLEATGGRSPLRSGAPVFCNQPFTDFEILDDGSVYLCSNVNLPFPVGNVHAQGWEEIWRSPAAREIRRSILDGDFRYCAPMTCPLQHGLPRRDALPAEDRAFVADRLLAPPGGPRRVALAYDRSCNLRCPSCRTGPVMAAGAAAAALDAMADRVVLPLLRGARVAHITGSGDPIASPHTRRLLGRLDPAEYPDLAVDLMTNGMLLDRAVWDGELRHLHGRMREVAVSLDGATAATYNALRPGGDFDTVCANVVALAGARRRGELGRLAVNMVVQACNFREMPALVRLCRGWGADEVRFYKLRQWGTYPAGEFLARDVVSPRHPRHGELLEVLRDPVFADPIVCAFELGHLIRPPGTPAPEPAGDDLPAPAERMTPMSTPAAEPTPAAWDLATTSTKRLLAWPRWDSPADLVTLGRTVLALARVDAGLCLCVRHDPAEDGDLDGAVRLLAQVLEVPGAPDVEVLVVDDPMTPADWPRLGRAAQGVLRLPSSAEGTRAAFLAGVGVPAIDPIPEPAAARPAPPLRRTREEVLRRWMDRAQADCQPYLPPIRLDVSLTEACNIRCAYCWQQEKKRGLLRFEDVAEVVDTIAAVWPPSVTLTGGEPTVWPDLERLVAHCAAQGVTSLKLISNGKKLADPALAWRLVEAGVTSVNLSADTLDPEKFARLRSFPLSDLLQAVGNFLAIRERVPGFSITIGSVIHREVTPQDLATLRAFCARSGIAHFMQTYLEFSDPGINARFELSPEERLAFHRELDQLEGRAPAARPAGDVRDRVAKREENPLTEAATDRCYKGVTTVKLYSTGDVSFCWSVPPVGNVREQPFLDIWTSDRARQCREFIRDRRCKCNFDCDIFESLELPLSAAERTRRVL